MPLSSPLALIPLLVAGMADHQTALWLDVPFLSQSGNGCGAACIVMVLKYWQPQIATEEPEAILRALLEPESQGITPARMEEYFRFRRYRTFAFRGTWEDLLQHLAKGRPLIVSLRNPRSKTAHYVVVAGIDPRQQLLQLNDPARGKLMSMHRTDFERAWRQCDSYTLLAVPPDSP